MGNKAISAFNSVEVEVEAELGQFQIDLSVRDIGRKFVWGI